MPIDFEKKYKEAYRQNVLAVPRMVREGGLDKKIKSFCERHDFTYDYVVHKINTNDVVRACFAVNPNKQNFYEKIAADFICKIKGVSEFKVLPNRACCVLGGGVFTRQDLKRRGASAEAKTIDFKRRYDDLSFYASHKYTKEAGGMQDNQYKDLQLFIDQCNKTTSEKRHFVALADGEYYQRETQDGMQTKLEQLRNRTAGKQVHACTTCELEILMLKISKK